VEYIRIVCSDESACGTRSNRRLSGIMIVDPRRAQSIVIPGWEPDPSLIASLTFEIMFPATSGQAAESGPKEIDLSSLVTMLNSESTKRTFADMIRGVTINNATSLIARLGDAAEDRSMALNRGWVYELRDDGALHLVDCPAGYLLVNVSLATQTCKRCSPTTFSINAFDLCDPYTRVCSVRECVSCPVMAAHCPGGSGFIPRWLDDDLTPIEPIFRIEPFEEIDIATGNLTGRLAHVYRLAGCGPGFVLIRIESDPASDRCVKCAPSTYSLERPDWQTGMLVTDDIRALTDTDRLALSGGSEQGVIDDIGYLPRSLCLPCPIGAICSGGYGLNIERNFWRGPNMLCDEVSCNVGGGFRCDPRRCIALSDSELLQYPTKWSETSLREAEASAYIDKQNAAFASLIDGIKTAFNSSDVDAASRRANECMSRVQGRMMQRRAATNGTPTGADQRGGVHDVRAQVPAGKSRNGSCVRPFECRIHATVHPCPMGTCTEGGMCPTGHGGVLCAVCIEGYTLGGSGWECKKCPLSVWDTRLVSAVAIGAAFFLAWFLTLCKPLWRVKGGRGRTGGTTHPIVELVKRIMCAMAEVSARSMILIGLSFVQITGSFSRVFSIDWPWRRRYPSVEILHKVASLDLVSIVQPECLAGMKLGHLKILHLYTFGGLIIQLCLAVPALLTCLVSFSMGSHFFHHWRVEALINATWRAIAFWCFVSYATLSSRVVESFLCDASLELMVGDYSQICPQLDKSGAHFTYACIWTVVYVLGMPLTIAAALVWHKVPHMAARKTSQALLDAMILHFREVTFSNESEVMADAAAQSAYSLLPQNATSESSRLNGGTSLRTAGCSTG
jgi:hypothetical protein